MRVFLYEPTAKYTFGNTLIAAKNKEEADKIAAEHAERVSGGLAFVEQVKWLSYHGSAGIVVDSSGCE